MSHNYNLFDSSISLNSLMEKVENVQYQAALAVSGCWQGSNSSKLYELLGWESLSDRRWARRLIELYKIRNNLTPDYLKHNLPPLCIPSFRSNNEYREIMCRTSRYKNSFFPDSVKLVFTILLV